MKPTRLSAAGAIVLALMVGSAVSQSQQIQLRVLPDGKVRINNGPALDESHFKAEIGRLSKGKNDIEIRMVPDRKASFDTVAKVLAAIQVSGHGAIHFGFTGTSQE